MSQSESRSNGMPESMVQIRNVTKVYERGKQKIEVAVERFFPRHVGTS